MSQPGLGCAKLTEKGLAAKSMKLNRLKLINFKNYLELNIDFTEGINCILGKNGMGKTNLLDAIHYISMTRSAINSVDQQNIAHGQPFFAINTELDNKGEARKVNCYFEKGKKKIIKVDGKEVEKLSNHIGTVPCVLITPDDTDIIREGGEFRRKFFDSVLSQYNKEYMTLLINMNRLLKQRNSFLKNNEGNLKIDKQLLDIYDESLIPIFRKVSKIRKEFIEGFIPFFNNNYQLIFEGAESPDIHYKSDILEEHFENEFKNALQKDIIMQRTSMGAHKDDYIFRLNGRPIKKFGSQGQQKSFIIALKLAEYDYLKSQIGFEPLLLLDDIFDKLDDQRIEHLVELLSDQARFHQIFITDAREERSRAFFKDIVGVSFQKIEDGDLLSPA